MKEFLKNMALISFMLLYVAYVGAMFGILFFEYDTNWMWALLTVIPVGALQMSHGDKIFKYLT